MMKETLRSTTQIVEYSKKYEQLLIDAYKKLVASESGKQAIRSRFWHHISLDNFINYLNSPNTKYRAIILNNNSEVIGWGEFTIDSKDKKTVQTSRIILPEYQNIGLGKELFIHLINKCKELYPEIEKLVAVIDENNVAAIQSLIKLLPLFHGDRVYDAENSEEKLTFYL